MKMTYYPGCSLQGTALDYDRSIRELCGRLGIELEEIPDWNCCGASSAHMTNHEIGIRLPMRNLLQVQDRDADLLVPCAACFQRLKAADRALRQDPRYWDLTAYDPGYEIVHISSLLARPEHLEAVRGQVAARLDGLRLACYYGCLSLRHPKLTGAEQFEQPRTLEAIVEAVGAEPVLWSHRTECCSGSLTMTRPDIAGRLAGDIVTAAKRAGAEALVTDCPMCQANVEGRQLEAGNDPPLPVFFATELVLAALDAAYPAAQRRLHLVPAGCLERAVEQAAAGEAVR